MGEPWTEALVGPKGEYLLALDDGLSPDTLNSEYAFDHVTDDCVDGSLFDMDTSTSGTRGGPGRHSWMKARWPRQPWKFPSRTRAYILLLLSVASPPLCNARCLPTSGRASATASTAAASWRLPTGPQRLLTTGTSRSPAAAATSWSSWIVRCPT